MSFTQIAKAILLYFQERNSLFAKQVLSEKLDEPLDKVRSEIENLTGVKLEQLVAHLEPDRIKRVIEETARKIDEDNSEHSSVQIKAITDDEVAKGGKNLTINYSFADTRFGPVIIASTNKGVCYLAFSDEGKEKAYSKLEERFPKATYEKSKDRFHSDALSFLKVEELSINPFGYI